jgi:hypothetical protein
MYRATGNRTPASSTPLEAACATPAKRTPATTRPASFALNISISFEVRLFGTFIGAALFRRTTAAVPYWKYFSPFV